MEIAAQSDLRFIVIIHRAISLIMVDLFDSMMREIRRLYGARYPDPKLIKAVNLLTSSHILIDISERRISERRAFVLSFRRTWVSTACQRLYFDVKPNQPSNFFQHS